MTSYPSIHDAYGGFGDRPDIDQPSTITILPPKKDKHKKDKDIGDDNE